MSLRKFRINEIRDFNIISLTEITEKKTEKVDFPLGGRIHPATINHHRIIRSLKKNEIRFNVKELLELLDDPSQGHLTKNYLNKSREKSLDQSSIHQITKGIL